MYMVRFLCGLFLTAVVLFTGLDFSVAAGVYDPTECSYTEDTENEPQRQRLLHSPITSGFRPYHIILRPAGMIAAVPVCIPVLSASRRIRSGLSPPASAPYISV